MEFRILGRLEIVGPDGILDLRGPKRRGLLAFLLVRHGEHLAVDRIVHDLWGPDADAGASRTVQAYASQLRRDLDEDVARITSERGGYTLHISPDALDSSRFERSVRRAGDIDDPTARVQEIERAIELWRGEPLDEFDGDWADRERTRLKLLYLQARDLRVDARLALGSTIDLVGELEQLVSDNPLDERLWAKLLIVYYRSGRQADALRSFQRVRSILAEELGVDPGPELVRLEQRILEHDASLLSEGTGRDLLSVSALPTGTVTFLFTDIEGSTRLWEERTEDMAGVVAQQHDMLRDAVERHDGHVVKTIGDGLMAVFSEAPQAVDAAIDAQLAITSTDWPVPIAIRMGLHTGTAHPIDGDYHAPAVNRAARVAGVAHPEQILLSETTAALTDTATLRHLGSHRLRGLAPMRLYQVVAPELRTDFPPNAAATAGGLPTVASSFVGRTAELDAVSRLIDEHRLVTLTGAGGCGKTRLAIVAAQQGVDAFVDGVRFVDLAPVNQDTGVDQAVADALGLATNPDAAGPRERVTAYLTERDVLIILDNCEHLLDACADLVDAVLAQPGASRIVATSREPLGLVAEPVLVVPSLDLETDAVGLFVERAQAARAGFSLDTTNREEVVQICRRLDGIPLAIELAAARTAHLSPGQMLDRLDDRFLLLTGGQRRIQRQHTLAATLDWSYDLLESADQAFLRRLAVFPASFTLEAAETVVDLGDPVERIGSLVKKSLVQTINDEGDLRYRLLESVRLYAEEKLVKADEAVDMRTRHCHWVHDWLESLPFEERLLGDHDVLGIGLPSIRAAVEWAIAEEDFDVAAAIVSGVDWARTEGWPDAFAWCESLAAKPGVRRERRLRLALTMWWLAPIQGWAYGRAAANAVLDQARPSDGPLYAVALTAAARDLIIPSIVEHDVAAQVRAMELAEQGVEASAGAPQPYRMYCRMWAGMTYASFRRPVEAAVHFAAEGQPEGPYGVLKAQLDGYLAIMCFVMGDNARALALAQSAFSPDLTPYWAHARALSLVALAAEGDLDRARRALRDYREVARDVDWVLAKESVVLLGGVLAGVAEDWPTASLLLGAGSPGVRRTPADAILYHTFRDRAREHLGRERARALRDKGRAMPIEEALAIALR